jgi:hypothetical protein
MSSNQCTAMTKKATQCTRKPAEGSEMCPQHSKLANNSSSTESTDSAADVPKTPTKPKKEPKVPGAPGRKKKTDVVVPVMELPASEESVTEVSATEESVPVVPATEEAVLPNETFAEVPKKGKGRPKKVKDNEEEKS